MAKFRAPQWRTPQLRPDVTSSIRRLRTRGRDPLVLVSVALVLATLVLAMLTFDHPGTGRKARPATVPFTTAVRGCPAVGGTVRVGSLGRAAGAIRTVQGTGTPADAGRAVPGRTTDTSGAAQPLVVTVTGPAAAGLDVGEFGTDPLGGARCSEPASDYWFTGLGASFTHSSVIQVANPADTRARVEITRWSSRVAIQPVVTDVTVPAHLSITIDLSRDAPQSGDLALHARVLQGQANVAVLDQLHTPGQAVVRDWLIPQSARSTVVTLLGLPQSNHQTLTIANSSTDQVTATVRLITKTSVFAPANFHGVNVPGNGVASADMSKLLAGAKDVIGIEVDAATPVSASLLTAVGGDVAFTGADPPLGTESAAVLPDGDKTLVIGAASAPGSVTVIGRNAAGKVVFKRSVAVSPAGGVAFGLRGDVVLLQLRTSRIQIRAAVVVSGKGAVVVPVASLIRVSSVPYVRPGVD